MLAGDFNSDGKLDLACLSYQWDASNRVEHAFVSILLGNGDGSFQSPRNSFAGTASTPLQLALGAVADLNEDGIPDLVLTGSDHEIMLGNGDGTFRPGSNFSPGTVSGVVVGDFNGDGHLDLAVPGMTVYLGNGDGTFQPGQTSPPSSGSGWPLAVADLNHDGKLDVLTPGAVLLGNGDGTFQAIPSSWLGKPDGLRPQSIAIGDFNGDGLPDVAIAPQTLNPPGLVTVRLGNGDGTFQPARSYVIGDGSSLSVLTGDFNGDGIPDLAVSDGFSDMVGILRGNGDGTFQPPQFYAVPTALWLVVGDFNGDGQPDLVTVEDGSNDTPLTVLLSNPDGTFPAPKSYAAGQALVTIAMGDFNGDGAPDVAVVDRYPQAGITVLLGSRAGGFQLAQQLLIGGNIQDLEVGDFNGDGKLDLVAINGGISYSSHRVNILLGNGDGTFQAARSYAAGPDPNKVAIGDFNGDGILDLAVVSSVYSQDGTVSVLLGNGNGSFQAPVNYAVGHQATAVAVGDFNGDDILDLAVTTGPQFGDLDVHEGSLYLLLGQGDGTFAITAPFPAGRGPGTVAVCDVNGDGKQDLIETNYAVAFVSRYSPIAVVESDVWVLLGNGDGTFQAAKVYTAGYAPSSVIPVDVNLDGIADLVVANAMDDHISVLLGNGDGTFQASQSYPAGQYPGSVAAADVNADGYPDLIIGNLINPGKVTVLLNAADWGNGGHAAALPSTGQDPSQRGRPRIHSEAAALIASSLELARPVLPVTATLSFPIERPVPRWSEPIDPRSVRAT